MPLPPEGHEAENGLRVADRSEIDPEEWEDLLAADPRSTLFQHPRWNLRYARHHPRARARWLEARDGAGELVAGLPYVRTQRFGLRAVVSGAGGTYAGPVARHPTGRAEAELIARFLERGGPRVVRRELVWGQAEPPVPASPWLRSIEAAVFEVPEDFEAFWRGTFPKNRRNECNRSERRGLRVELTRDEAALRRFLPIYEGQAKEWGIEAEPGEYLVEVLREEPRALFFVARFEQEVIGGHVCFQLEDQLFAWTGTTQRREGLFPSSLLIKEEARYVCEHGLGLLNLGSSLGLSGVASYKRLLGASSARRWLLFREARPLGWVRSLRRGRGEVQ
jgi:CelD/BcsL family acetyltransferase involved in cellulose biosynthesis